VTPRELVVEVVRLRRGPDLLALPRYMTPGSAGMDLLADIEADVVLPPGGRQLVATGIAVAIPPGFEGQVRPRSGLALRHGLTLLNAPGTIDADYRGEVQVLLANLGSEPARIRRGDRVAQLVIAPVARATWHETDALPATERGAGGFGSTEEARVRRGAGRGVPSPRRVLKPGAAASGSTVAGVRRAPASSTAPPGPRRAPAPDGAAPPPESSSAERGFAALGTARARASAGAISRGPRASASGDGGPGASEERRPRSGRAPDGPPGSST